MKFYVHIDQGQPQLLSSEKLRFFFFSVALSPQRPYRTLGTGSPGRPQLLSSEKLRFFFFSASLRPQRPYGLLGTATCTFTQLPNSGKLALLLLQCCFTSTQSRTAISTFTQIPSSEPVRLKPVLNWANVCSPSILRTLRRTMIRFLIELLVRRTWFGQSKLYFVLNWLVMRCKLRPELEADAQQTA